MLEQSDINSNVVFFGGEAPIAEVVKAMVDREISSVLVIDEQDNVIGILTERDIVRKFTLLDMADKMERKVAAVMTRGVIFADLKTFRQDVLKLHLEKKIRHFPILRGKEPKKENIVGILSITDILRAYIVDRTPKSEGQVSAKALFGPLFILVKNPAAAAEPYQHIFAELGYNIVVVDSLDSFLTQHLKDQPPLLVDLDHFSAKELHPLLPAIHIYPGPLVLTSANLALISSLRKFQKKNEKRLIAAKPLDFSYVHWLLASKWGTFENKNAKADAKVKK